MVYPPPSTAEPDAGADHARSDDLANELALMREAIRQREREVARLDSEILELEREIEDFRERYQQALGFVEKRLEAANDLLSELQRQQTNVYTPQAGGLPSSHIPVEEQYRRTWARTDPEPPVVPVPEPEPPLSPADLKQLYRSLARLYHPDYGVDEADRERRTRLMALINEAYAAGDVEALRLLEQGGTGQDTLNPLTTLRTPAAQSLATLELHRLRQRSVDLAVELEALKARQSELLNSDWMNLKLEETLLKLRGRDLFSELKANFEREFAEVQTRIDRLRGDVR